MFFPSFEEYFSLELQSVLSYKIQKEFLLSLRGRVSNFLAIISCIFTVWWLFFLYILIPWKEKLSLLQPKTSCWNGCQQNCGVKKTTLQTGSSWISGKSLTCLLPYPLGRLSPSWSVSFASIKTATLTIISEEEFLLAPLLF